MFLTFIQPVTYRSRAMADRPKRLSWTSLASAGTMSKDGARNADSNQLVILVLK